MRTILLSLFILFTTTSFCQSQWQEDQSQDGVKFLSRESVCDGITYRFLKIENVSNAKVKVTYQLEMQYEGYCIGCNGLSEYQSTVILLSGDNVSGSCNYDNPAHLDVLLSNPNLPDMRFVSYAIKNIVIETLD